MRRRLLPESPTVIPGHLARFTVDEWVAPGEIPPHLPTTVNGQPPTAGYVAEAREILAWGRHRRALRDWHAATRGRT